MNAVDVRTLARALGWGAFAASFPGLFALPFAFVAPPVILVPIMTFGIAFLVALVFGLPVYLVLERVGWANSLTITGSGFVIGALFVVAVLGTEVRQFGQIVDAAPALLMFGGLGAMGARSFYAVLNQAMLAEHG